VVSKNDPQALRLPDQIDHQTAIVCCGVSFQPQPEKPASIAVGTEESRCNLSEVSAPDYFKLTLSILYLVIFAPLFNTCILATDKATISSNHGLKPYNVPGNAADVAQGHQQISFHCL